MYLSASNASACLAVKSSNSAAVTSPSLFRRQSRPSLSSKSRLPSSEGLRLDESSGCDYRQLLVRPPKLSLARAKRPDDLGIELSAVLREDLVRRLFPGQRRAIGTIARHRVERVGESEDARAERNPVACQGCGITQTVPALVMGAYHAQTFALE